MRLGPSLIAPAAQTQPTGLLRSCSYYVTGRLTGIVVNARKQLPIFCLVSGLYTDVRPLVTARVFYPDIFVKRRVLACGRLN